MKSKLAIFIFLFIGSSSFGITPEKALNETETVVIKDSSSKSKLSVNSIKDIDAVLIQDNISIGSHAPVKWVLDVEAAKKLGLCAVYIVKNFNFDNSPAILYPRLSGIKYEGDKGIEALVQNSAREYKVRSAQFTLEKLDSYKNKKNLNFEVRKFLNGPSPNNFEMVAYFKIKKEIFIVVYSAKDLRSFNQHSDAFNDFLEHVAPYDTDMGALSGRCLYPK